MKITHQKALRIRGGRVVDPFSQRNEVADVTIVDGVVAEDAPTGATELDAEGWIIAPGLTDIHVHLREPGQTHKETIETGTAAAALGGFTCVACMPNTNPTLDHPDVVRLVLERAANVGHCAVGPVAAITRGREGGELTDFAALLSAGAVAFSDDGSGVEDDRVMRAAFEKARELGAVLIQHCEYSSISAGGVMHKGEVSSRLGLPGIDARSEEDMIERDIDLCRATGGRYHVSHISTARSVEMVRGAKADGLPITAEVCPHHLLLTDEACGDGDANTKMHPPLRTQRDVEACLAGIVDGTIDCLATDHAPHTAEEKAKGFVKAPPGIVGLETAVATAARALIDSGRADWARLIAWFTTGPADVLGRPRAGIQVGQAADLAFFDPKSTWAVEPSAFASLGRNTPFAGWEVTGRPLGTLRGRVLRLGATCAVDRL